MTTTFAAIRAGYIATIQALVPVRLRGERFRHVVLLPDVADLLRMATDESLKPSLFRLFQIRDNHDDIPTTYTDLHTVRVSHTMSLDVAYPKLWGKYGPRDYGDADDLIREDFFQIDRAIGITGAANWQASQHMSDHQGGTLIDSGPALVRRSIYRVEYDKELGP